MIRDFALSKMTMITLAAAALALLIWSALGGQPLAILKYKAEVVKEKAASAVGAHNGR